MGLCCLFWCQSFGDVSPYVCSYYFSSVWVGKWPPFGKYTEQNCQPSIFNIAFFRISKIVYTPKIAKQIYTSLSIEQNKHSKLFQE